MISREFRSINSSLDFSDNLNKTARRALQDLSRNRDIVLKSADKKGIIVIQKHNDYVNKSLSILSDTEYHRKLDNDPTNLYMSELKIKVQEAFVESLLPKNERDYTQSSLCSFISLKSI